MMDCCKHGWHKQLIADSNAGNLKLKNLLEACALSQSKLESENLGSSMNTLRTKQWKTMQHSARSLYQVFSSCWKCGCKAHGVQFQLQDDPGDQYQTKVALSIPAQQQPAVVGHAGWEETIVISSPEDLAVTSVMQSTGVTFVTQQHPRSTSSSRLITHDKVISGLCQVLSRASGNRDATCLGFIQSGTHKHYINLLERHMSHADRKVYSLQDILGNLGGVGSLSPIGLLDRYELALLLASCLPRLHATSWLSDQWSCEDIRFVPAAASSAKAPMCEFAFVTQAFPRADQNQSAGGQSFVRSACIRNESIFALGIVLVELSLPGTLSSRQTSADQEPELSDLKTALRLTNSDEWKRNNVLQWISVVETCLNVTFIEKPDFGKDSFRKEYFQRIVAPLEKLCRMQGRIFRCPIG